MANQRANYMLAPRSSEIRRHRGASIDSAFEDIPHSQSLFKRLKSQLSTLGKSLIRAIFRDPSLPMSQESEAYNRISTFKPALISTMPKGPSQQDKSTSAHNSVKKSAQKRKPQEELKPRAPPVNFFKLPAKPVVSAAVQTKEEPPKPPIQPVYRRGRPGPVLPREVIEKKDKKLVQIREDLSRNQIMSQAYEAAFYDLNFKTLEEIASKKQEDQPKSLTVSQEPKPTKKLEITTQSLISFESKPMETVETPEEHKHTETDLKRAEKKAEEVPGIKSTPIQPSARISFFAEDKQDVIFEDPGFVDSEPEEPEESIEPQAQAEVPKPIEIQAHTSPNFGKVAQPVFPYQQEKPVDTSKNAQIPEKPQEESKPEAPKFGFQPLPESLKSPEKPTQPPSTTLQLSPQSDNPFLNTNAIKTSQVQFVFGSGTQQSNLFGSTISSSNPFGSNTLKPVEASAPSASQSNPFLPASSSASSGSNPFIPSSTNIKPNPFSSEYSTSTQPSASFPQPKQDASGDIEMNSTPTASPKLAPVPFPVSNPPFNSSGNSFLSSYQPTVPPFPTGNPFPGSSLGSNQFGSGMSVPGSSTNVQLGNTGSSFSLGLIPQKQRKFQKARRL